MRDPSAIADPDKDAPKASAVATATIVRRGCMLFMIDSCDWFAGSRGPHRGRLGLPLPGRSRFADEAAGAV
jgi:hypothetical protein